MPLPAPPPSLIPSAPGARRGAAAAPILPPAGSRPSRGEGRRTRHGGVGGPPRGDTLRITSAPGTAGRPRPPPQPRAAPRSTPRPAVPPGAGPGTRYIPGRAPPATGDGWGPCCGAAVPRPPPPLRPRAAVLRATSCVPSRRGVNNPAGVRQSRCGCGLRVRSGGVWAERERAGAGRGGASACVRRGAVRGRWVAAVPARGVGVWAPRPCVPPAACSAEGNAPRGDSPSPPRLSSALPRCTDAHHLLESLFFFCRTAV